MNESRKWVGSRRLVKIFLLPSKAIARPKKKNHRKKLFKAASKNNLMIVRKREKSFSFLLPPDANVIMIFLWPFRQWCDVVI